MLKHQMCNTWHNHYGVLEHALPFKVLERHKGLAEGRLTNK